MDYQVCTLISNNLLSAISKEQLADLTQRLGDIVCNYFSIASFESCTGSIALPEEYAHFYYDMLDAVQEFAEPDSDLSGVLNACTLYMCKTVNILYIHIRYCVSDDDYYSSLSYNLLNGVQRIH